MTRGGRPRPADHRVRRRGPEEGSLSLWLLGLAVAVLFLGGLSIDLWRAFAERRDLAAAADAAAAAGASVLDEEAFRTEGVVVLEPAEASAVACAHLRLHVGPGEACAGISATPASVEVRARRTVELTLLRVLLPAEPPLTIEVTAHGAPRRMP